MIGSLERKEKQTQEIKQNRNENEKGLEYQQLLSDHSGDEILVTDLAIRTNIYLPDPLIKLSRLKLLADAGEDVSELGDGDESGGVLVDDLEGVTKLAIEGLGFHVFGHEIQKSGEIEGGGEILLGDDGFELGLGRVSSEGTHEDSELGGGDLAVAVGVEECEGFLHGRNLVIAQILTHFCLDDSLVL